MRKKYLLGMLAILLGVIGVTLVLSQEKALVLHPKGIIAQRILGTDYYEPPPDASHHRSHLHPVICSCVEILH